MAPPLVPLHIAANTKGFSAARVRALERLLAGVRVAVNFQARGSREGFVAGRTDVAFLGLRVSRVRRGSDVVVVLPGVCGGHGGRGVRLWREARGQWTLVRVDAVWVTGLVGGIEGAGGGHCAGRGGVRARGVRRGVVGGCLGLRVHVGD
jgi:hypothetical protein